MAAYADHAPDLAMQAIAALGETFDPARITHIVVASCTGFVAPGIDQILARRLGLAPTVERVLIGFMGCYAGVTALRAARHIVRSQNEAVVLVVSVELSTLHLSLADQPEPLLAMLQFSDGAAAGIVSAAPGGLTLGEGRSLALEDSAELIRWDIGDKGFEMHLSGEVPGRLREALAGLDVQRDLFGTAGAPPLLAVHAGGRSVLDAVEHALAVPAQALADSRSVLARFGNMSSATILFVLAAMMARGAKGEGIAIAFGPGLAAEAIRFEA
jgi:predicted naringenin-chalcone synthase